jgi:rhamnogalacturonan endolyase
MKGCLKLTLCAIAGVVLGAMPLQAQRQAERLGRGVVAINQGEGKVFISWRLLGTDPETTAFNVYRSSNEAQPTKLNPEPLSKVTFYQDEKADLSKPTRYFVRPIVDGREGEPSAAFSFAANAPVRNYLSIPLKADGGTPNDCSVGDLDGDGEYEVVVKRENGARDNSQGGITGPTMLEAYKLDGTFLWRINLGPNIRGGAHYTQFMVYDLDGDGRAEIACKTADGTIDGAGKVIGDPKTEYRNPQGHILAGPELFTIFDGKTGAALTTINYKPARAPNLAPTTQELRTIWGDGNGNRSDRYLACIAYLDGERPSVVMCRGYYTRTTLWALDWRDGKLTERWFFDSDDPDHPEQREYRGQGNHEVSVADVDEDGKDEIIYGACTIDDNGKGLYSTGLRHGDALHVSDLDPSRPGLEVAAIHENENGRDMWGTTFRSARTGEIYFSGDWKADVGRGLAADVDPRYSGAEIFAGREGPKNTKGEKINVQGGNNFAIWWDGDLLREILNSNQITKWDWENGEMTRIFVAEECQSNNGTKSTPALSGDILGDWREELMERTADNTELRIFVSTIPTEHRMYTLMHDIQYREAIAWQNVAYNQPPWPSFFIGHDMKPAPRPNIRVVGGSTGG